jgi:hypothetical protein
MNISICLGVISGIHRFRESSYLLRELRKMVNPETLATLGKQENGTKTQTHTHDQENIK